MCSRKVWFKRIIPSPMIPVSPSVSYFTLLILLYLSFICALFFIMRRILFRNALIVSPLLGIVMSPTHLPFLCESLDLYYFSFYTSPFIFPRSSDISSEIFIFYGTRITPFR